MQCKHHQEPAKEQEVSGLRATEVGLEWIKKVVYFRGYSSGCDHWRSSPVRLVVCNSNLHGRGPFSKIVKERYGGVKLHPSLLSNQTVGIDNSSPTVR